VPGMSSRKSSAGSEKRACPTTTNSGTRQALSSRRIAVVA
jgi:hypothetical protein